MTTPTDAEVKRAAELLRILKAQEAANAGFFKTAQQRLDILKASTPEIEKFITLQEKQNLLRQVGKDLTIQEAAELRALDAQMDRSTKSLIKQTAAQTRANRAMTTASKGYASATKSLNMFAGGSATAALSINSFTDATIKAIYQVSKLNSDIARQTGQAVALKDNFHALVHENGMLNVTLDQAAQIIISLQNEYAFFAMQSDTVQRATQALTADLLVQGIAAEDVSRGMDVMTSTLQMTGQEAIIATKQMRTLAYEVSRPMGMLLKDFKALEPQIARFGRHAMSQFEDLAKMARSLAVTTQDVFNVAEGFDTWSTAAEKTMKLNIQFGTRFNSVALMSLDHYDRIEALRAGFEQHGLNVAEFGRREVQMLGDAFGVSDDLAVKIMGRQISIGKAMRETEEANKRQQAYMSAQEKIMLAIQQVIVANEPVITKWIESFADGATNVQKMAVEFKSWTKTLSGAMSVFGMFASAAAGVFGLTKAFTFLETLAPRFTNWVSDSRLWKGLETVAKWGGKMLGLITKALGPIMAAKDLLGSTGWFDDTWIGQKGSFFDMSSENSKKRLAAGSIAAAGGAGLGLAGGPFGALTVPGGAWLGYGTGREIPALMGAEDTGMNDLPPGKANIPVNVGPQLDDFFLIDGMLHRLNEGDLVMGGTNLLGQDGPGKGRLNKGDQLVVKELTMPITLKVGKDNFHTTVARALDVIADPTYAS